MTSLEKYIEDREEHEITEQRDITLESNPTVDDICSRYEEWLEEVTETLIYSEYYDNGLTCLKGLEHTAQEVREFSIRLKQYEDKKDFRYTGLFLSALFDTCPDEKFEILTEHLETPIHYIGYENTKQVTVNGNAGDGVGRLMKRGSITVSGDAGDEVGRSMEGGSITINGNAGKWVGEEMGRGSITVNGNAGKWVGRHMKRGSITVNGDAGDKVGYVMKGGSITVNGNAGDLVGWGMEGGSIKVNGNAGKWVGDWMEGGSIRIEGEIGRISGYWKGGEIYHKGKRVRPE